MARKHLDTDELTTSQQLAERIRGFRTGARPANPALDALTGKRALEELAADIANVAPAPPAAGPVGPAPNGTPASSAQPASATRPPPLLPRLTPAPTPTAPADSPLGPVLERLARTLTSTADATGMARGHTDRYSVYLGSQDVQNLNYVANHWPRTGERTNRSELIRTAIRALVRMVEQAERDLELRPAAATGDRRDETSQ